MKLRTAAATVFASAVLLVGAAGAASAGEITGNGKATQGPAHAQSICVFSGLEDGGDFPGQPSGPGATPQNWGHTKKFLTPEEIAESNPGVACNGHTGFIAQGGGE